MTMVPSQTLERGHWDVEEDLHPFEIAAKEARWWYLHPGEEGYDQPLYRYLGMTEAAWREYAISARRVRP